VPRRAPHRREWTWHGDRDGPKVQRRRVRWRAGWRRRRKPESAAIGGRESGCRGWEPTR